MLGRGVRRVLITGNESKSYAASARLSGLEVLLAQSLSLASQDRTRHPRLAERLRDAGLKPGDSVGVVGWKYLEAEEDDVPTRAFFVPAAYVRMIEAVVGGSGFLSDVTAVLMHPETGLRSQVDADQIAAWEWAATRCSHAVWQIVSFVREGDSEYDAVARMRYTGEPINVQSMFASASRCELLIGLRRLTGRGLRPRGEGAGGSGGFRVVWFAADVRLGRRGSQYFLDRSGGGGHRYFYYPIRALRPLSHYDRVPAYGLSGAGILRQRE